jgi:hypothetical protein
MCLLVAQKVSCVSRAAVIQLLPHDTVRKLQCMIRLSGLNCVYTMYSMHTCIHSHIHAHVCMHVSELCMRVYDYRSYVHRMYIIVQRIL